MFVLLFKSLSLFNISQCICTFLLLFSLDLREGCLCGVMIAVIFFCFFHLFKPAFRATCFLWAARYPESHSFLEKSQVYGYARHWFLYVSLLLSYIYIYIFFFLLSQ